MTRLFFLGLVLLFHQNVAAETEVVPLKNNMVSTYLNKALNKFFDEIAKTNLSIAEVGLGEDVGRFSEIEGSILGELGKTVDGIGSYGFKLNASIEEIAVGGKYDLVHLDVPLLFPFFGKGCFSLSLKGISLDLQLKATYEYDKDGFSIDIPKLDIAIRKSKVHFENLMNDPSLADFLNELISNLVPDIVTMLTPPILELMKPTIDHIANGILLCIKRELATGKVEECIKNLFQKTSTVAAATFYEQLKAELNKAHKKF